MIHRSVGFISNLPVSNSVMLPTGARSETWSSLRCGDKLQYFNEGMPPSFNKLHSNINIIYIASHFWHNEILGVAPPLSLLRILIGPVILQPAENNSYQNFSKWICKNSGGNLANVVLTMPWSQIRWILFLQTKISWHHLFSYRVIYFQSHLSSFLCSNHRMCVNSPLPVAAALPAPAEGPAHRLHTDTAQPWTNRSSCPQSHLFWWLSTASSTALALGWTLPSATARNRRWGKKTQTTICIARLLQ